jgi:DNA replication ATP-dependent helicase Dna2
MNEKIDEIVHKGLSELLKLEVSVEHAKREVRARAKGLLAFSQKYLSQTPKVRI